MQYTTVAFIHPRVNPWCSVFDHKEFSRIAVISSKNAAGLEDFFSEAKLLQSYRLCAFDFYHATMQGAKCATEVTEQLRVIFKKHKQYDAAVIVRGGGSQSDLDAFNQFMLANAICKMPLPIFTGIGHRRDNVIIDELANQCFDTPSKVIHHIVNTIVSNAQRAKQHKHLLQRLTLQLLRHQKQQLKSLTHYQQQLINTTIQQQRAQLSMFTRRTLPISKHLMLHSKERLHTMQAHNYHLANKLISHQNGHLRQVSHSMIQYAKSAYQNSKFTHEQLLFSIPNIAKNALQPAKQATQTRYQNLLNNAIQPTLNRGFVSTKFNGKYITSAHDVRQLNELTIIYKDGQIKTELTHEQTDIC